MEALRPTPRWRVPRPGSGRRFGRLACGLGAAAILASAALAGCSEDGNPLAPYGGSRPLDVLEVTQRFMPEIQWVGGRVAALGVNRGTRAALDSTLVWLRLAPGDDIASFVTFGDGAGDALVAGYGGVPLDSLADGETYTFWLAERSAFEADLDSTRIDPAAFVDTTLTMRILLEGNTRRSSDLDVSFVIERDERLTEERFVVRWTPADVRFRQLAIREAATTGGFMDLIWHVVVPEGDPASITSPVTIGVVPEGTQEAIPFPETGFTTDVTYDPEDAADVSPPEYTLWATTDDWNGSFDPRPGFATGYAQFLIQECNFDIDNPFPDEGFYCD